MLKLSCNILAAVALLSLLSGCQTTSSIPLGAVPSPSGNLSSGDVVRIVFSGAPELTQVQKVRADGKITVPLLGEIEAAGRGLGELQTDLSRRYRGELKNSEVLLSLQTSNTPVYVSGAVNRPGKILLERPLTALEAIMEAGGISPLGNLKKVVVIRNTDGQHLTRVLDLSGALRGEKTASFALQPQDIVHVPERFF